MLSRRAQHHDSRAGEAGTFLNPARDDPNAAFARPVKQVMVTRLETISADAPIADLLPLFRKDYVAIVMDGDQFLGVATRLDLINYFRIAI